MSQQIINSLTQAQLKPNRDNFKVGDGVRVHTKVREGDKERIQIFSGMIVAHKGTGIQETFTVRRISYGEGVERVFPVHSPNVEKIEIERESVVRKARLYHLRSLRGKKATKVKEKNNLIAEA